jgi:hypothetical protein
MKLAVRLIEPQRRSSVRAAKANILTLGGRLLVIVASLASAAIFVYPAAAQTPMCNLGSPAQIARFNEIKAALANSESFNLEDFKLENFAAGWCQSPGNDCVLKYFITAQDLIGAEYRASRCEIRPERMMNVLDMAIADHVYWFARFQPDGHFHKEPTVLQEQFVQFLSGRPATASLAIRWLEMHGLIAKFKVFDAARVRKNSNAFDQYFHVIPHKGTH